MITPLKRSFYTLRNFWEKNGDPTFTAFDVLIEYNDSSEKESLTYICHLSEIFVASLRIINGWYYDCTSVYTTYFVNN